MKKYVPVKLKVIRFILYNSWKARILRTFSKQGQEIRGNNCNRNQILKNARGLLQFRLLVIPIAHSC